MCRQIFPSLLSRQSTNRYDIPVASPGKCLISTLSTKIQARVSEANVNFSAFCQGSILLPWQNPRPAPATLVVSSLYARHREVERKRRPRVRHNNVSRPMSSVSEDMGGDA